MDDLMTTFSWNLEGDARNWICILYEKSIAFMADFLEFFLMRWHEGEEEDIKQLAKKYNSLLPRTQPNSKEEEIREVIKLVFEFKRIPKSLPEKYLSTLQHNIVGSLAQSHTRTPPLPSPQGLHGSPPPIHYMDELT